MKTCVICQKHITGKFHVCRDCLKEYNLDGVLIKDYPEWLKFLISKSRKEFRKNKVIDEYEVHFSDVDHDDTENCLEISLNDVDHKINFEITLKHLEESLTPVENKVLNLLLEGYTPPEVMEKLRISKLKFYRIHENIKEKIKSVEF